VYVKIKQIVGMFD